MRALVNETNSFGAAAKYYDEINAFRKYDSHTEFIIEVFKRHARFRISEILDLACGTGSHALRLAQRGYSVTGIDESLSMLSVAKAKAEQSGIRTRFEKGDLGDLRLTGSYDAAYALYGVINLLTPRGAMKLFGDLHKHLKPNGVFILDFYTTSNLSNPPLWWLKADLKEGTLLRLDLDLTNRKKRIQSFRRTYLLYKGDRILNTFTEEHSERCYFPSEIRHFLKCEGFEVVETYGADNFEYKLERFTRSYPVACIVARNKPNS